MKNINWDRVRKIKESQRWYRSNRALVVTAPKVVATGTNVICPNGQMGRVVNHQNSLNVVINAQGKVLGCYATGELRLHQ